MFLVKKVTHTSSRKFTFTITEENVGDAQLFGLLGTPGVNRTNAVVEVLFKTGDESEANDYIAKLVKANEADQFFVGIEKPKKKVKPESKSTEIKRETSSSKKTYSKSSTKDDTKNSSSAS